MTHKRELTQWKPYRFFPWAEYRYVGLFLDTAPGILVDISAFWIERRFRSLSPEAPQPEAKEAREDE